MINYVIKNGYTTIIYYKDGKINKTTKSVYLVINELCIKYFSTFFGRIEAIKNQFGFKRKIPILVSNSILLLPIYSYRSLNSLYINYYEINDVEFETNIIIIEFKDKTVLKLDKNVKFELVLKRGHLIHEEIKKLKEKENVFI